MPVKSFHETSELGQHKGNEFGGGGSGMENPPENVPKNRKQGNPSNIKMNDDNYMKRNETENRTGFWERNCRPLQCSG